jgi:hypothetical protein
VRTALHSASFALAVGLFGERAMAAEPSNASPNRSLATASADEPASLQSPEQRDTRHSAYSLPKGMWGFDVGALGIGVGDAYAKLGAAYGVGAGIELDANLAHWSIGLLNVGGRFHFVDTKFFDLGALVGIWYGHGEWFWILTGPAKELVAKLDVIHVPVLVTASMPVLSWLQFDLETGYKHGEVFGSVSETDSAYFDAEFGVRQVVVRPGVRLFLSDNTEFGLSSNLPPYSAIPVERDVVRTGERNTNYRTVPFSEIWSLEAGFRSRFAPGLFGSLRLHYGEVARGLYGAVLNPSFNVEFRL